MGITAQDHMAACSDVVMSRTKSQGMGNGLARTRLARNMLALPCGVTVMDFVTGRQQDQLEI